MNAFGCLSCIVREDKGGKPRVAVIALLLALALPAAAFTDNQISSSASRPASDATTPSPRFVTLDVFVDSAAGRLAAYQVEITATTGKFMLVGIAGGDHPAFAQPPFYDPAARANGERIILAAFNTGNDLPTGKVRIAQLQLEEPGPVSPTFSARLSVAADSAGHSIPAIISLVEGAHP